MKIDREHPRGRAGLGRPAGSQNKSTRDIRAICAAFHDAHGGVQKMLTDLYARADVSQCIDILKLSTAYQYGRPKESVTVDVSDDIVNLISEARQRATQKE